jgi:hypothetical protein
MRKASTILLAAFCAAAAFAGDYKELNERWYNPEGEVASSTAPMTITGKVYYNDGTSAFETVRFEKDRDGKYFLSEESEKLLHSMDFDTADIVDLTASLIMQVNRLVDMADLTNARFETLHKNLDGKLKDFWDRLNKLELDDTGTGTKKTLTLKDSSSQTKLVYTVSLGLFVPDGKSVNTARTVSGSSTNSLLQMRGFDKAEDYAFPYKHGDSLLWDDIGTFFDTTTVGNVAVKVDGFDDTLNLLGLTNWDKPDKTCSPTLGAMVSGVKPADAAQHYVLTRCADKDGLALHYTKIGGIAGGADNAGKYLRTSSDGESSEWAFPVTEVKSGGGIDVKTDEKTGAVTLTLDGEAISVQSEATTDGTTALMSGRRVVFRAMDDSCVKVDVAQGASTNEIVVSIGCYYK